MDTITIFVLENAKVRLGRNIRKRREQIGLTQTQLGARVEMSATAIGMLERGETWPEWENIQKIAKALETADINFFAGAPEPQEPTPAEAARVISDFVKKHST